MCQFLGEGAFGRQPDGSAGVEVELGEVDVVSWTGSGSIDYSIDDVSVYRNAL